MVTYSGIRDWPELPVNVAEDSSFQKRRRGMTKIAFVLTREKGKREERFVPWVNESEHDIRVAGELIVRQSTAPPTESR